MLHSTTRTICCLLAFLILLTGCDTAPAPTLTPAPTREPTPAGELTVTVFYPTERSEVEMGWSPRFTVQVFDAQGRAVSDAHVTVAVQAPAGETVVTLPASHGGEGVYRTAAWTVPHRTTEGTWRLLIEAETDRTQGNCISGFQVKNSTSEVLLANYGFWIDKPKLRAEAQILIEMGDARNGLIRWSGSVPTMHIMPYHEVAVHWREGRYDLTDPAAVWRFLKEGIGDLGDMRRIDPFQPMRFKHWEAWWAACRMQFREDKGEWVVFYAPEVDKTYAIATTLALPPENITDPHARLRNSFAVFPDVHAAGVAPVPLLRLLPGPELIAPPLAARFQGMEQPIILQWQPVRELAEDEYYEVAVDYWYRETHPTAHFATRETQLTLPETLYHSPNCAVFNWRVTLKRQTGLGADGQPVGEPVSYASLYWYLWWQHPPGQEEFPVLCPYTHLE